MALLSLNELGVSLAIVRWPGDPRSIAPTVTTIAVGASAVLYAGCWLVAPMFAKVLGVPGATGVVRLICVSVVIDGLTSTPAQLLNREFRQGSRLLVDLTNLLVTTAVTVLLATTHHGAYSLAAGQLVGNGIGALALFRFANAWPRPGFDRKQAAELLRFGLPLAGASALMIAMLNIQYVVIGPMLGAVALGLYLLAFNLSSWPVNVFSQVVRRVSLAAFARVQDDQPRRQEALIRMATLLTAATLPVCALLGLLALPAITTVYGTNWKPAAAVLPFLAILAFVRVASELAYDFLVALGRSGTTLWLQTGWLCSLGVALPLGASLDGIRGVALAHGVVALLVMLPAYGVALARTGVPIVALMSRMARPAIGCGLLVIVVMAVRLVTESSPIRLFLGGVLGIAAYLPVVWPLREQFMKLD
jgi:PST family polysaccharide transporter